MSRSPSTVLLLLAALAGCSHPAHPPPGPPPPQRQEKTASETPRLVVWLTLDQFRGDYYGRYRRHFTDTGFARLFERGRWYTNAHFSHAITETAPGHATLFTGVEPSRHGIVGNSWLEPSGREVASVSDERFPLLGPGAASSPDDGTRARDGRSPLRLRVPTLAESVTQSTVGQGLIFSLSAKDRGAILPAGRTGRAFWLGDHGFVTSKYYMDVAPTWLVSHHQQRPPASYLVKGWQLLKAESEYENGQSPSPRALTAFGRGFPHEFTPEQRSTGTLKNTPFGDLAVLDLARTVVESEKLGQDASVDLLAISLSATDYIGHSFGPESREMEDHLMRLDRQLANFFSFLDQEVGASSLLLVLSSDHGGCESDARLTELGLKAGRLTESDVQAVVETALAEAYGHTDYLLGVSSPYVYLKPRSGADDASILEVSQVVASALAGSPGVHSAHVLPLAVAAGTDRLLAQVAQSDFPGRSGQVYVVPEPYVHYVQEPELAATHGSPWAYDTHVPVVLSGANIPAGTWVERVDVRSLAPTVAHLIGVLPPAAASEPLLPLSP